MPASARARITPLQRRCCRPCARVSAGTLSRRASAMRAKGDAGRRQTPCVILLMGAALGWSFRDADSFHPQANIDKMSRGIPLTDEDRAPWLEAIAAWIDER